MRTTIYLDEKEREAIKSFPRGVSMSVIFRCLLLAGVTSMEEWNAILAKEPDILKARDAIKEKLKSVGKRSIIF
jgi:hypothetical protein